MLRKIVISALSALSLMLGLGVTVVAVDVATAPEAEAFNGCDGWRTDCDSIRVASTSDRSVIVYQNGSSARLWQGQTSFSRFPDIDWWRVPAGCIGYQWDPWVYPWGHAYPKYEGLHPATSGNWKTLIVRIDC